MAGAAFAKRKGPDFKVLVAIPACKGNILFHQNSESSADSSCFPWLERGERKEGRRESERVRGEDEEEEGKKREREEKSL